MTDFELLMAKIKESGMTVVALCKKAGINRATFYKRLNDVGEFTASEIVNISKALCLTKPERDKIFLSKNVK